MGLQKIRDEVESPEHTPALLSLQQLAVGGDLNVEGHLHVEQVLVLPQVTGHVILHTNRVERSSVGKNFKTKSCCKRLFYFEPSNEDCWKTKVKACTGVGIAHQQQLITALK